MASKTSVTRSRINRLVGLKSKRRIESFLKAEAIAQELRHQLSTARCKQELDTDALFGLLCEWMKVTGAQKYERPND